MILFFLNVLQSIQILTILTVQFFIIIIIILLLQILQKKIIIVFIINYYKKNNILNKEITVVVQVMHMIICASVDLESLRRMMRLREGGSSSSTFLHNFPLNLWDI